MPFGSHPFQDLEAVSAGCGSSSKSPMPFGSHPFQDVELGSLTRPLFATGHQCLSAVIRFRTFSSLGCLLYWLQSHQCLSAVIRFRTSNRSKDPVWIRQRSPMPFGSHPFQDAVRRAGSLRAAWGHQCLSAVIRFRTRRHSEARLKTRIVTNAFRQSSVSGRKNMAGCSIDCGWSPMPFGSHPFQDAESPVRAVRNAAASPMPFGSHPFQDWEQDCES